MLLIFVSPLMRSPLAARPRSSRSTCKDDRWERYRCGYSLPFEGEAESDVRNSFLVVDRRRARVIRIELYRKQYDQ